MRFLSTLTAVAVFGFAVVQAQLPEVVAKVHRDVSEFEHHANIGAKELEDMVLGFAWPLTGNDIHETVITWDEYMKTAYNEFPTGGTFTEPEVYELIGVFNMHIYAIRFFCEALEGKYDGPDSLLIPSYPPDFADLIFALATNYEVYGGSLLARTAGDGEPDLQVLLSNAVQPIIDRIRQTAVMYAAEE